MVKIEFNFKLLKLSIIIKKDRSAHPGTVKAAGNICHIAHYMILPERLQAEIRILPRQTHEYVFQLNPYVWIKFTHS